MIEWGSRFCGMWGSELFRCPGVGLFVLLSGVELVELMK
jgi:hypothetical protein